MTQAINITSELFDLKENDLIYTADYIVDKGKGSFDIKEFKFIKYIDKKSHIEGLETNENSIIAELKNTKHPKISVKTDISSGFFHSEKDAVESFVDMIENIATDVRELYNKKYS